MQVCQNGTIFCHWKGRGSYKKTLTYAARCSIFTFPSGGCTSKNRLRFIYELAIFPKWVSSQLEKKQVQTYNVSPKTRHGSKLLHYTLRNFVIRQSQDDAGKREYRQLVALSASHWQNGWWHCSVVRTSVFGWRTFPDLCLIYGWHVTTSCVRCPLCVIQPGLLSLPPLWGW